MISGFNPLLKKLEGRESEKQMILFKVQVFFFKSL